MGGSHTKWDPYQKTSKKDVEKTGSPSVHLFWILLQVETEYLIPLMPGALPRFFGGGGGKLQLSSPVLTKNLTFSEKQNTEYVMLKQGCKLRFIWFIWIDLQGKLVMFTFISSFLHGWSWQGPTLKNHVTLDTLHEIWQFAKMSFFRGHLSFREMVVLSTLRSSKPVSVPRHAEMTSGHCKIWTTRTPRRPNLLRAYPQKVAGWQD